MSSVYQVLNLFLLALGHWPSHLHQARPAPLHCRQQRHRHLPHRLQSTDYPPHDLSTQSPHVQSDFEYWPEPWSSRFPRRSTHRSPRIASGPLLPEFLSPGVLARLRVGRLCKLGLFGSWVVLRPRRVVRRRGGHTSGIARCIAERWGMRSGRIRAFRATAEFAGGAVAAVVG